VEVQEYNSRESLVGMPPPYYEPPMGGFVQETTTVVVETHSNGSHDNYDNYDPVNRNPHFPPNQHNP
jgi:hypothetical protein